MKESPMEAFFICDHDILSRLLKYKFSSSSSLSKYTSL
jgi:hypothetical protein